MIEIPCTNLDAKTLKFGQELTKEMIKDSGGVEGS